MDRFSATKAHASSQASLGPSRVSGASFNRSSGKRRTGRLLLASLQCVSKQTFHRLHVGVKRPLQERGSGGGSYSSVFKTGQERKKKGGRTWWTGLAPPEGVALSSLARPNKQTVFLPEGPRRCALRGVCVFTLQLSGTRALGGTGGPTGGATGGTASGCAGGGPGSATGRRRRDRTLAALARTQPRTGVWTYTCRWELQGGGGASWEACRQGEGQQWGGQASSAQASADLVPSVLKREDRMKALNRGANQKVPLGRPSPVCPGWWGAMGWWPMGG